MGMGGAVFNYFGTLTFINCTVSGNTAQGGSGGMDVIHHTAGGNGAGVGGGVFNWGHQGSQS